MLRVPTRLLYSVPGPKQALSSYIAIDCLPLISSHSLFGPDLAIPPSLQMIAKAVEAAAPSRERTAWYERKAHWERNVRRRQEARAAGPSHSVVHAQGAAASASRPGVARWQEAMGARGGGGGRNGGRAGGRGHADGDGEEDDGDGGYRLNKIQTVLAVAVMLVMAVFKLRSVR